MFVVWLPHLNSPELTKRLQFAVGFVQCMRYGTSCTSIYNYVFFNMI